MRSIKLIFIILSLFSFLSAFCSEKKTLADTIKRAIKTQHRKQDKWPRPKSILPDSISYYNDCVFINKYTQLQLLSKYPFNRAVKILAVSYQNGGEPNVEIGPNGEMIKLKYKPYQLHVKNGRLDPSSLFELKKFSKGQIERLSNLMYNTDKKVHFDASDYADPGSKCFFPRNAILFVDSKGKIFDYIEICFQCTGTSSKSGKLYLSSVGCNQALGIAQKLLIDIGIKFGTTTTDDKAFQQMEVKY